MLQQWGLWAGFGLCPWSDLTVPVHFLVVPPVPGVGLEPLVWQCLVPSPWKVNAKDHQAFGPFGPVSLPGMRRVSSVQARLCLRVARGCLDPNANNNNWMLWRSQCHWCVYLRVLLGESRTVNIMHLGGLWAPLMAPGNWGALLLALLLEQAFGWLCSQGPSWRDQGWPGFVSWLELLDSLGVRSWGWWTRQHSKD